MKKYEKMSGFSDEITEIAKDQFEALNRFGIRYFEPRGINGKNISELTEQELHELKALMEHYGIRVSSIGSPVGKIKMTDDFEKHFEVLKNVVKAAKILDTKYIRVFSFYHQGNGPWTEQEREEVIRRMRIMTNYAAGENVILLHENEKDIYGDTADRCLDLMQMFYGDHFKAVFDPANFVQSGEDTKRAYEMLKPYIAYMHIKDALLDSGEVMPVGYGDGNVEYILKDLFASGFDGFLSLEPHLGNFKGFADLEIGAHAQQKKYSGEEAFALAYKSLMDILKKIER